MKTSMRIGLCLLVVAIIATWSGVQAQKDKKGAVEIAVTVPPVGQEETELRVWSKDEFPGSAKGEFTTIIDGKEFKHTAFVIENKEEGSKRSVKIPSFDDGKTYKVWVEAVVQPNNYTHIYRKREVTLKAGENLKVDLTVKDLTDNIKARWYPTPGDIVDEMAKLAKITKDDVVYDLGCGDAVMLIRPLQKFPAKRGVGIEIDPKMVKIAKEKVKEAKLEDKIEIREGDILNVKDMSDATVVLLYIGDDLGERLSPVLQKTLKPGARIVSHRFSLGDWKADKTITVKGQDGDEYDLLLWTVGAKKDAKSAK